MSMSPRQERPATSSPVCRVVPWSAPYGLDSRLQAKPYGRLCPGWDLVLWSPLGLACRELVGQRLDTLGCAANTQQRQAEMGDAIEDAMQGHLVR